MTIKSNLLYTRFQLFFVSLRWLFRQRDLEQSVSSLQPEGRDITTFQPVVEGHPIPDVKQGYQYLGPGKPIPFDAPINQNQLER